MFFGTHVFVIFPGPALISSVACNLVAFHGSVWLSALRQPAHYRAAPKCHTPSLWRLLSFGSAYNAISSPRLLRQSPSRQASTCGGSRLGVFQRVAANLDLCKNQVSNEQSAYRRPASRCVLARCMCIRQNICTSRKGSSGMPRSSIQQPSKVCLCSSAVSSRHSLTFRSMGRLHHCSLRQGHAGAPYLWR